MSAITDYTSPQDPPVDPITLTNTTIVGATSAMNALALRVERQSQEAEQNIELWYYRDADWHLFPVQPLTTPEQHPVLSQVYQQPATLQFYLPDPDGLYVRQNRNSAYNRNLANEYDPLVREARKILLRVGSWCYGNLSDGIAPTSTLAPSAGALSSLTNSVLGDIATANTGYVTFSPSSTAAFDLKIDLGSNKAVRHVLARFATKVGNCSLPTSLQVDISTDNATWTPVRSAVRPLGGNLGDWDEDYTGRTLEIVLADITQTARYVRLRITPIGSQTIKLDEVIVYGGTVRTLLGANLFVGSLGKSINNDWQGLLACLATDVLQRAVNNNEAGLTAQFRQQDTADIIYSLATSNAYWRGAAGAYDAPFTGAEIGWSSGVSYTNFLWPAWQGQSNNLYGYWTDLVNTIGMEIYGDGNGILQLREIPYRQLLPDRLFIAAPDGNQDVRGILRLETGDQVRNVVEVASGDPNSGAPNTLVLHPGSIAEYGRRRVKITDPIATTQDIRSKIGGYVLRDYAWRVDGLTAKISPDFNTHVTGIYGFRAINRLSLYAKASTGSEERLQELWRAEQITHHIMPGEWWAQLQLTPYLAIGPGQPTSITATPEGGDPTKIDLAWTAPSDPDITGYGIYVVQSTGEPGSWPTTPSHTTTGTGTTYTVAGLTNGLRYWFFVTAIGANGQEGTPSAVVSAVAGGAAGDESNWTITDLAVAFNQVIAPQNNQGYYEYEFLLTWTAPPVGGDPTKPDCGFKHGEFRFHLDSIPSSPLLQKSWTYQDEWHGDRIPPTLEWDRTTVGSVIWYGRFRSATSLSGHTVYWRVWTWMTTNGFHGPAHPSNVVSAAIP